MSTLQGRRCADKVFGEPGDGDWPKLPGEYAMVQRGDHRELFIVDPLGHAGRCSTHTITEEPDGTITVQPSIAPRPDDPPDSFHGWLTKGVWTW